MGLSQSGNTLWVPFGTTSTTAAAGNDSRIVGTAQKADNLSDMANAATARANLGQGDAATLNVGSTAGTVADGGALAAETIRATVAESLRPLASPFSGSAADRSSGTLPAGRLPLPGAATLGGVKAASAPAHQFVTGFATTGAIIAAQPVGTDISGLAAAAAALVPVQSAVGRTGAVAIGAADVSGLGGAATLSVGTGPNSVASGNDPRIIGAVQAVGGDAGGTVSTATGATAARTLADRAADAMSVKDFGAKCDGTTDDTAALQAAFTYAAGGHGIAIPAGTCTHTGLTLDLSADTAANTGGMVVAGAGAGWSVLKLRAGSTGNGVTVSASAGFGNQPRPVFRDLTFNCNFSGLDCVSVSGLADSWYRQSPDFTNVTITWAGRDGLAVGTNANAGHTDNLWIAHPGRHGMVLNSGDWRISRAQFYGARRLGPYISSIASNGSGLIRATTSSAHGLSTGEVVEIYSYGGSSDALGTWTITNIDAKHFDLQGSTYVRGTTTGYANRVVPITGAADNGAGLVRITSAGHGFTTDQHVFVRGVAGVPIANGLWAVTRIDADTFDLQGSVFSGTYTSGGTARLGAAGTFVQTAGSNFFENCTWYANQVAFQVNSSSSNIVHVHGGEISGNWTGGIVLARSNNSAADSIRGVQFATNSLLTTGTYSDISLWNTGGTLIEGNQFVLSGNPAKYLVHVDNLSYQIDWGKNGFRQDGTRQPWATAITNDLWSIPGNRWGVSGGWRSNSGGQASVALGYGVASSGQGSLAAGVNSHDKAESSFVFGGGALHAAGDNQMRLAIMSVETTNATPTRLTVGGGAAGAANTFNSFFNYSTVVMTGCTAVAQHYGAAERAVWVLPTIVLTRDASASAMTIRTGTGLLTSGTQTATYASAGMGAVVLSVTADTTNGGLNVTATGLAGTTIDWSFACRMLEDG